MVNSNGISRQSGSDVSLEKTTYLISVFTFRFKIDARLQTRDYAGSGKSSGVLAVLALATVVAFNRG